MPANPSTPATETRFASLDTARVAQLCRLLFELRSQCRQGWDINILKRLHGELGLLTGQFSRDGQIEVSEQLLALETALGPALTRMRTPDAGTTALVAALTEHLRELVPPITASTAAPSTIPTTPPAATDAFREAEYRVLMVSLRPGLVARLGAALPSSAGFSLRTIFEPLAVLEELSRFRPDIVLSDFEMPVCDGPELAEMIHERQDFSSLPVLYLAPAGESPSNPQVLPLDIEASELAARIRQEVRDRLLREGRDTDISRRRGQYRRAWLLDRLDATLVSGNPNGGLLDISIDRATVLHRHLGMSMLMLMHEQLGSLIGSLMAPGDMLAESGAGYLLLSRERSRDNMHALAEELRQAVAAERFGPAALPLTITIGGCTLDGNMDAVDCVVSAAQRARQAAAAGEVRWHHQGADAIDPLQLEKALQSDRLHLVYQAIVNVAGAPMPQYQALLRLRDAEGYVHTAAELLPVARRAGLLAALDRWVLERALKLLAEHQRQTRPLRLFISQSGESLEDRDYPAWIASRLEAHGVRGTRLVLDFRCDDIGSAPRELLRAAPRLRALGVGLCLSGIDRGLQAAQLLDALTLDYIKLAPEVTAQPGALLPIAHARHIAVIAPLIEDSALIHNLRKLGVDCVQGHSLAHPARLLNYAFDHAAAG